MRPAFVIHFAIGFDLLTGCGGPTGGTKAASEGTNTRNADAMDPLVVGCARGDDDSCDALGELSEELTLLREGERWTRTDRVNQILDAWKRSCEVGPPKFCASAGLFLESRLGAFDEAEPFLVAACDRFTARGTPKKHAPVVACVHLDAFHKLATLRADRRATFETARVPCAKGDLISCKSIAGVVLNEDDDIPRGTALLTIACEGGEDSSCRLVARLAVNADGPTAPAEDRQPNPASGTPGALDLRAGIDAERASGYAERAAPHFDAACAASNGEGCRRAAGYVADATKKVALLRKGCWLGDALACMNDLACVSATQTGELTRGTGDKRRVIKTFGVETITRCKALCAEGLPGACYTAGTYLSSASKIDEAKRNFQSGCKLGDQRSCSLAK